MTVPKSQRTLSCFEAYDHGVRLRTTLTEWLLRDFGIKDHAKNLKFIGKKYKIEEEDKQVLANLLEKYHLGDRLLETFPEWWIRERRVSVDSILREMMVDISMADSINVTNLMEFDEKKLYLDKAIASVYTCLMELQFIISVLWKTSGCDLEKYMPFTDLCKRQIELLKNWRERNNKLLSMLENKTSTE